MGSLIYIGQNSQRIRPQKRGFKFLEEGVEFLRDVCQFVDLKKFERVHIFRKNDEEKYILSPDSDLYKLLGELREEPSDCFYSPHLYLPGPRRTEDRIVQLNAVVIDLDDANLDRSLDALAAVGIEPHYVVYTSYEGYQLVIKQRPIRLGKGNREAMLARQQKLIEKLYRLAGGDMRAAKVNQMFRLPGSRRETGYGIWGVGIIEKSSHPPYSLGDLERAVGLHRHTFHRYTRRSADNDRMVCSSPAVRWIRTHTIREGYRNSAIVALAYAYAMDHRPMEEALSEILEWVQSHTQGPYPEGEARQTIRSCYSNPKGLDWRRLIELEAVDGQRMSESEAKSVFAFMPHVERRYDPVPQQELKNMPAFHVLGKVLKTLWALQRANHCRPVTISARELARAAGVPPGTLENRLVPALNALRIRRTSRKGKSTVAIYDMRCLNRGKLVNTPYAFMESMKFRRPLGRVLTHWAKRFGTWWWRFRQILLTLLYQICSAFPRSVAVTTSGYPNVRGKTNIPIQYRAPPRLA